MLPVPPVEAKGEGRLHLHKRLHLLSMHRSSKDGLRDVLIGSEILGMDASDRPPSPSMIVKLGAASRRGLVPSSPMTSRNKGAVGGPGSALVMSIRDTESLVREAEVLLQRGASEDQWSRMAAQLTARAYDVEAPEVLRMVRAIGIAAQGGSTRTASGKKELLRAADHIIQSLTPRLHSASLELLIQVLETMSSARVGSQAYLDMLMAILLGRHHRDCQALAPAIAVRIATALGRLAAPDGLRLRPKGVGGPSTAVNMKFMEALQKRVVDGLESCGAEDLARLDDYYLTRLCSDPAAHAILTRMGELEIGLHDVTKDHLPMMIKMQESVQRELPDTFRWSLARPVRDYLEQLRLLGLRASAPWAVGDLFAPARSKLHELRFVDDAVR